MNDMIDNVATVGSGLISFIVIWLKGIVEVTEGVQIFVYAAIAALGGLCVKFLAKFIIWAIRRLILKDKTPFFKYKL